MLVSQRQPHLLRVIIALAISCAFAAAAPVPALPSQATSPELSAAQDLQQQAGPFALGDQNYTVVMRSRRLRSAAGAQLAESLASLQIRDAAGAVIYEKVFPLTVSGGAFQQSTSASVERLSGNTGAGLLIHYTRRTIGPSQTEEFWQLFGVANGRLAPLGKPATIGEPNPGGPYMGVIMRAANGAVSVISQPDTIELRAWTGHFHVFIPLRVDWNHGGLAQGQRCVERLAGPLQDVGCPMRVDAIRQASAEEFTFLRLFAEANENFAEPEHIVLQKDSSLQILGASAITTWIEQDALIRPAFSDLWLHVRINNRDGWIHGEEDFASVGLPAGNPAP